jgi:hypothetical protein
MRFDLGCVEVELLAPHSWLLLPALQAFGRTFHRGWLGLLVHRPELSFEHDCWAAPMDVSCHSPKANAGEVVAKQVKGFVRTLEERDGVPFFVFDVMLGITSKQASARQSETSRLHN